MIRRPMGGNGGMAIATEWLHKIRVKAAPTVLIAGAVHLAALLPLVGSGSFILDNIFRPYAEHILSGNAPYSALHYEYPPGSIPIVLLPGLLSDSVAGFRTAFDLWMLAWDLAILSLLGALLKGKPKELLGALVIYSAGLLALGSLSLERFDLAPAALALAALVILKRAGQERPALGSASWGVALGAGIAIKAWPLAMLPALLRAGRSGTWALVGVAAPITASLAGLWLAFGEGPQSAVSYHTQRELQIESLGATPFVIAARFGVAITPVFSSGSFNIEGSGVELARAMSIVLLLAGYLLLTLSVLWRKTPVVGASTVLVAWTIVVAPVLSPQFLIWVLPLAAASLALRWEALPLIVACALTRLTMEHYDEIPDLSAGFVWSVTARNAVLLVWLVLLIRLVFRAYPYRDRP